MLLVAPGVAFAVFGLPWLIWHDYTNATERTRTTSGTVRAVGSGAHGSQICTVDFTGDGSPQTLRDPCRDQAVADRVTVYYQPGRADDARLTGPHGALTGLAIGWGAYAAGIGFVAWRLVRARRRTPRSLRWRLTRR